MYLLLLLSLIIASCTSAPKQENEEAPETEEAQETNTLEDSADEDDELLTGYGLIQAVEDGAYPMYIITVNFPKQKMIQTFNLNAEELEPRIEQLGSFVGKYASIKYTSTLDPYLIQIKKGENMILGNTEIDPKWKLVTGTLFGAAEITSSDLPSTIRVSNEEENVSFNYYVDDELVAVNNTEVTAYYILRPNHTITSIIIPEKETNKETAVKTTEDSEEEYPSGTMMVDNSYLILQSTTSYSAAMFTAKQASKQLGAALNLRGYIFDFKEGLKDTTACGCGEIHGYVPRGRFDDGNYVSIEHSDAFTEFTNGYYIVVAGSGKRSTLKPLLAKAKQFYGDAYVKDAEVYIGCMH
jgi:hypothetical protein